MNQTPYTDNDSILDYEGNFPDHNERTKKPSLIPFVIIFLVTFGCAICSLGFDFANLPPL